MKLLLKIKYDGSGFCGYQVQPNTRTVQGELNRAASELFGCECAVTGCSRTDSGVHALSFFATIEPKSDSYNSIPTENVTRAINTLLPNDIGVVCAYQVEDTFHARYDVISKEYVYLFCDNGKNPFLEKKALQLPKEITDEQLDRVNCACSYLLGTHDFTSFMAEGSKIVDATREIYSASIQRSDQIEGLLIFKISANGFLYNMVRIIVGTMLDVAYGKVMPPQIEHIIMQKNRALAGQTVAPYGLYLNKVIYNDPSIL